MSRSMMESGASELLQEESESEKKALQELDVQLERVVDTLWRCSVIVEDFDDVKQEAVLHDKVKTYINDLRRLDEIASKVDVNIPVAVLKKVDKGLNPDLVTRDYVDMCRARNDDTRGRIFATQIFKEQLSQRLKSWTQALPLQSDEDEVMLHE